MKYPTVSDNPNVQAFYVQMRKKGQSHNIAEMCALREASKSQTDTDFFRGVGTLADQFRGVEWQLEHNTHYAKKNGYKPNHNDFYISSLARFPGDPQAFVPATGGRGYIKKICEERGIPCEGMVNYTPSQRIEKEPESCKLAPDIVENTVNELVSENPDLKRTDRQELREMVIEKHGAQ